MSSNEIIIAFLLRVETIFAMEHRVPYTLRVVHEWAKRTFLYRPHSLLIC